MNGMQKGLALLVLCVFCQSGYAHVRWFASPDAMDTTHFSLDTVSLLLMAGAILYCALCIALQQMARQSRSWCHWLMAPLRSDGVEWDLLRASIAFLFIGNILTNVFIAPNLTHPRITSDFTTVVQAVLIIVLVLSPALFACGLLIEVGLLFFIFGAESCMDYVFELVAVALALFIAHRRVPIRFSFLKRGAPLTHEERDNLCCTIIRLGIGLQLIELAIHNKFMNPGMALQFVDDHSYFNFIAALGVNSFTNLHFALSAGLAELSFGLLLLLNIAGRFVAACVLFFFSLTSVILGLHELIGHVPIIVCLLTIIIRPGCFSVFDVKQILLHRLHRRTVPGL